METKMNNTSEKILETAIECLSLYGYANVSMRDIASRAEVALSQVTYYYKTKEFLYCTVIDTMASRYLNDIEEKLNHAKDTEEKYILFIEYFKEVLKDNEMLFRLFMDFSAQALWNPSFATKLNDLFKSISKILEEQIFKKDDFDVLNSNLVDYSAEALSRLLVGALYGVLSQVIISSDMSGLDSLSLLETILDK